MSGLTPAPQGYPIKLVRDRTPEILNASGEPGDLWYAKVESRDVRERFLRLKLAEEVGEFLVDGGVNELADVYAVVHGLAALYGADLDAIKAADPRGGFFGGVMMYGRHDEFDGRLVSREADA